MRIALDLTIFICTALAWLSCFRGENGWDRQTGLAALRYFTILSNLFCALAALALALTLLGGFAPRWIWLWKYVGTAAVTVTLLTVLVFLGPAVTSICTSSGRCSRSSRSASASGSIPCPFPSRSPLSRP